MAQAAQAITGSMQASMRCPQLGLAHLPARGSMPQGTGTGEMLFSGPQPAGIYGARSPIAVPNAEPSRMISMQRFCGRDRRAWTLDPITNCNSSGSARPGWTRAASGARGVLVTQCHGHLGKLAGMGVVRLACRRQVPDSGRRLARAGRFLDTLHGIRR